MRTARIFRRRTWNVCCNRDWLERRGRQPLYTGEQSFVCLQKRFLREKLHFSKEKGEELLVQNGIEEHSHRNGQQSRKKKSEKTLKEVQISAQTGRGMAGENN